MGRKQHGDEEADGTRSKPSLVSRIKAKVKLRSHGQTDVEAVSSTAPSIVDRPVLSGLPTILPSDIATKVDSQATEQMSIIAIEQRKSTNNESPAKTSKPSLWTKALEAVTPDTRQWIEALLDLGLLSQYGDKGDQLWSDSLIAMVEALESEHRDKPQQIATEETQISLGDLAASVVACLTMIGDVATQFASPTAGIIWPIIKTFLQLSVTGVGETAAALGCTEKVIGVLKRGKVYETVFTEENTAPELLCNLEDGLIAVYAKSLDLLAYAARHIKKEFLKILNEMANPGQAKSLLAELMQLETDLVKIAECCEIARVVNVDESHTKLLLRLHESTSQTDDRVRQLLADMEIREMLEALDYISDVKFGEQHRKKIEMRTPETGQWLLSHDKFQQWMRAGNSTILWLQGTVGMGKSFLASAVIDRFMAPHAEAYAPDWRKTLGFAYFYCERGIEDLSEPISILRSYVRQLSTSPYYPNSMQKKLLQIYRESRKNGVKLGIQTCKDQLYESVNFYSNTTLVLDGLDECNPEERWQLIEILVELVKHAKNPVKLFISSRREQDIVNWLSPGKIIEIDASDNEEDIRKFVEQKIGEIEKMGRWISISQDLKIKVKDTLCAKSDGMFRWAYLQMDQLSKLRQANQLEYRLGKLPKTLNNAYTEIFQSIEDGDRETLERAVKWIMCARRPLRTKEILDAVRLSAEPGGTVLREDPEITEETLLELCSHLVIKDSKLDEWKFPHASVIEYFEEVHQWDIERAHSLVAKICLLCLMEGYASQKMSVAKEDETVFHNKEGIEYYIRHNWDLHVLALENTQPFEAEVSNLLQIFLGIDKSPHQSSQQYRRWFYDRYRYRYFSDEEYIPTMTYLGSNFEPIENPVFGICILGFCNLLRDYWIPGIDVMQTNRFQMDLLSLAAHYGQVNLCCKFIELGSNVNRQLDSPSRSQSALCAAVSFGSIEAVKFLLGKGADPNLPLTGASAVCASITKGKGTKYIEALREAGADLNLPCGPRCSLAYPFESAAADGNVEAAKYLLSHGANVDLYSENGIFGSALTAAAHGGSEQLCLLLIDRGVDVNASLRGGRYGSALAAASTREVCQLLIKHGADVNASLKCGEYGSALAAAAYAGNLAVCRLLVENQADVNAVLEYGEYRSALGAALVSSHCDLDVIKYLIENAHADASVLSITSPKIHKRKHTLLAAMSMARTTKPKTSYMLERNLVDRSTLLRIGFEEDELPRGGESIGVWSPESFKSMQGGHWDAVFRT